MDSSSSTPSPTISPQDFHSQLLPVLRKENGFLTAQEIIPYYGLYISGSTVTRNPSLVNTYSGILSVNGETPYLFSKNRTVFSSPSSSSDGTTPSLPSVPLVHQSSHNTRCLDQILILALDDHTSQSLFPYLRLTYEFIQHHRLRYWYSSSTGSSRTNSESLNSSFSSTYTLPSKECKGGILVHCTLGISRSSAIIIAYIMMHSRLPVSIACKIVQRARPWIRPNDGFLYQLYHLEFLLGLSDLPVNVLSSPSSSSSSSSSSTSTNTNGTLPSNNNCTTIDNNYHHSIEQDTRYWPRTLKEVWNYPYPQNTYGHIYIYIHNNIIHTYRFPLPLSSFSFTSSPSPYPLSAASFSSPSKTPDYSSSSSSLSSVLSIDRVSSTVRNVDPSSSSSSSSSSSVPFFLTIPFSYPPYDPECSLCTLARTTKWYGIDWNIFETTYINPFLQKTTSSGTIIFQLPLSTTTVPKPFRDYTITNHPAFVIMDCDTCSVPMIVLRFHLPNWKSSAVPFFMYNDMHQCLSTYNTYPPIIQNNVGDKKNNKKNNNDYLYFIDEEQRTIPDHAHAHLRTYPVPANSKVPVIKTVEKSDQSIIFSTVQSSSSPPSLSNVHRLPKL